MEIKQVTGVIWVGRIKTTITRAAAYFGYVNFGLLLLTFYSVAGYKYAPLWAFLLLAATTFLTIGAIDYFIVLPSEQAFVNQQIAMHQNPIYEAIKEIKEELKK